MASHLVSFRPFISNICCYWLYHHRRTFLEQVSILGMKRAQVLIRISEQDRVNCSFYYKVRFSPVQYHVWSCILTLHRSGHAATATAAPVNTSNLRLVRQFSSQMSTITLQMIPTVSWARRNCKKASTPSLRICIGEPTAHDPCDERRLHLFTRYQWIVQVW